MATPDYTVSSVLDGSRALLNDQQAQIYTNADMLAYAKTAFRELREFLQLSNVPVTNKVDEILVIPASTTVISFTSTPALPADLVEIQQLWQRPTGIDPWYPLTRREFLPPQMEGIEYSEFIYWAWVNNEIHLLASTQVNDLKVQYIQQQTDIVNEDSVIGIINGKTFLEYRCAALAARYMMEDPERAQDLDANADIALDRTINIENKARQSIFTRRRPFRANWKARVRS